VPLSPGEILNNRYRIIKLLGQGGFGAVYHAWDCTFELPCAVKENTESTGEAQRQFLVEAKILHTLRHPNLPLVKDYFLIAGQGQYLIMDFVEGQDLQEILSKRGKPLPETQVIPWIQQVCKALEYLHSQHPAVIHRDLKPANIKVTPEGKAVLVDFGLSKIYDPNQQTESGAHGRGTPGYSPPEQYGQGSTDPQSDVYALGATLYHCLTGIIPPDSVDILTGVKSSPTPAHRLNLTVSVRIGTAVERAMQIRKEIRWGSVQEFRAALTPTTPYTTSFPHWKGSTLPLGETKKLYAEGTLEVSTSNNSLITTMASTQVIAEPPKTISSNVLSAHPPKKNTALSNWIVSGGIVLGVIVFLIALITTLQLRNSSASALNFNSTEDPKATFSSSDLTKTASQNILTQTMAAELIKSFNVSTTNTAEVGLTQTAQTAATEIVLALAARQDVPMVLIPEGEFLMGSETGNGDELPSHMVYLDAYYIDVFEVTNTIYTECVEFGMCDPPHDPVYYADPAFAQHPVVNLDWHQAQEYCVWRGGSLPTEAQWEKAARGGVEEKNYPWGDEPPVCDKGAPNGAQFGSCGSTVEVGNFSPNGYGLYDTSGNVWEWVWDWYSDSFYSISPNQNPTGPDSGQTRTLRGGSWYFLEYDLRVSNRLRRDPNQGFNIVGFRCARSASTLLDTIVPSSTPSP